MAVPSLSPRRVLLLAAAAVILLMLLFPPFQFAPYHVPPLNLGYAWLFSPPNPRATIDGMLLLIQLAGTLTVTALVYLALPSERQTIATPPGAASQRIMEAILDADPKALQAALSQFISAEIAGRR